MSVASKWFFCFFLLAIAMAWAGQCALASGLDQVRAAEQARAQGRMQSAVEHYGKAIESGELNPAGMAVAHNNRGVALRALGKLRPALADYTKAIEYNPDYAQAYYNAGHVRMLLGEDWRALKNYDKAIELVPNWAMAYHNRGILWCRLGRYQRGLADFNRAIRHKPEFALAYYNAGHARMMLGQPWRAAVNYDKALAIDPGFTAVYAKRGLAWQEVGYYQRAMDDFDRALAAEPRDREALLGRARAAVYLGEFQQAARDLSAYLELKPPDATDQLVWLLLCLMRSGQDPAPALERLGPALSPGVWPRPLVEVLLGKAGAAQARRAAKNPDKFLAASRKASAEFFLAQRSLLDGDIRGAKMLLASCLAAGMDQTPEYRAAQAELKRLRESAEKPKPGS